MHALPIIDRMVLHIKCTSLSIYSLQSIFLLFSTLIMIFSSYTTRHKHVRSNEKLFQNWFRKLNSIIIFLYRMTLARLCRDKVSLKCAILCFWNGLAMKFFISRNTFCKLSSWETISDSTDTICIAVIKTIGWFLVFGKIWKSNILYYILYQK